MDEGLLLSKIVGFFKWVMPEYLSEEWLCMLYRCERLCALCLGFEEDL